MPDDNAEAPQGAALDEAVEATGLFAQFDGDEVLGKFYAYGEELDSKVDHTTRAVLASTGRFAATKPAEAAHVPTDNRPDPAGMSRAALLAELSGDHGDDELRYAVRAKREHEAARDADESAQSGGETIPQLTDRIASISDVEALRAERDAEVAGKNRGGALSAIDARIAAVESAGA